MGYLRCVFMLAVLVGHGLRGGLHSHVALYGFFLLSGYLITAALHERYTGISGRARFLINRFLRLFPPYWVCLALALGMILLSGDQLRIGHRFIALPSNWADWRPNLTIFGLAHIDGVSHRPAPLQPAWSLSAELWYYLLSAMLIGGSRWLLWAGFLGNLGLSLYALLTDNFAMFHYSVQSCGALYFAGGLLYHYRHRLRRYCPPGRIVPFAVANLALYAPLYPGMTPDGMRGFGLAMYFLSLPLAWCIISLSQINAQSARERYLADITYPAYLLHMTVLAFIRWAAPDNPPRSWLIFGLGATVTVLLAVVVLRLAHHPLVPLRQKLRQGR